MIDILPAIPAFCKEETAAPTCIDSTVKLNHNDCINEQEGKNLLSLELIGVEIKTN